MLIGHNVWLSNLVISSCCTVVSAMGKISFEDKMRIQVLHKIGFRYSLLL